VPTKHPASVVARSCRKLRVVQLKILEYLLHSTNNY
jgi:hypothetical protein